VITKKCIGCGYCCIEARCIASIRLHPSTKECPELRWDENKNRYVCKLMQLPGDLGAVYRRELYVNAGCCSPLNTWRNDVKFRG
jgi:hypothetical protein